MPIAADFTNTLVALRIARSRIDGYGVFAAEMVSAGNKLGELTGEPITVAEARRRAQGRERIMMVELSASRAIDCTRSADPLRFANHSCRPNARIQVEAGAVEFFALRDIASGEEITVGYGATHHEGRLVCRCRQDGCTGWL
ncbi:SET domain-containing protein [Pelomonas sp. KK5]|uniref:SET domain-containing protein n=1 Tax=Pelomonas sp. KK5 TaxID=1855730 RepID=UPI001E49B379|nr:SET domain-containing protein-lysine N-methyltransferase [Pelomonas sp. KK5]